MLFPTHSPCVPPAYRTDPRSVLARTTPARRARTCARALLQLCTCVCTHARVHMCRVLRGWAELCAHTCVLCTCTHSVHRHTQDLCLPCVYTHAHAELWCSPLHTPPPRLCRFRAHSPPPAHATHFTTSLCTPSLRRPRVQPSAHAAAAGPTQHDVAANAAQHTPHGTRRGTWQRSTPCTGRGRWTAQRTGTLRSSLMRHPQRSPAHTTWALRS